MSRSSCYLLMDRMQRNCVFIAHCQESLLALSTQDVQYSVHRVAQKECANCSLKCRCSFKSACYMFGTGRALRRVRRLTHTLIFLPCINVFLTGDRPMTNKNITTIALAAVLVMSMSAFAFAGPGYGRGNCGGNGYGVNSAYSQLTPEKQAAVDKNRRQIFRQVQRSAHRDVDQARHPAGYDQRRSG